MILTLIAAVAENGVIGRAGDLPWHLPEDLKRFKRVTRGHQVIMGRKTFETLSGPLPDRRNIVVTRRHGYSAPGVVVASSIDQAIEEAERSAGVDEPVYVLGGGEIYAAALPLADAMDLTRVHAEVDGDTRFPDIDWAGWELASQQQHEPDDRHVYGFTFETWRRRAFETGG